MPKLLVVVDDTQSRDALDVALQLHWPHVTVVAARSGEEALRVVRDQEEPGNRRLFGFIAAVNKLPL